MSVEEIKKELENWTITIDDKEVTIDELIKCIDNLDGWTLGIYNLDLENKIIEFGRE